jgi:hypothetical protein
VGVASAESAAELQQKGERLATERHYTEAIDAFKAADKLEPSASHSCFIALAYTRRELWPQAEIFMKRCRAGGAVPDWVPEAEQLVTERIAAANVAPVEITVAPAGIAAQLTVSSFAPDETFAPGTTIHLPPGHHVVLATAAGYEQHQQAIDITDKSPRRLAIELSERGQHSARAGAPSKLPRTLLVAGGVALGAGVITYGVMGVGWYKLRQNNGANFGTKYETMYDVGRVATIGLWSAGAALAITGYVLRSRHHEDVPATAFVPVRGGGVLAVEWKR